MNKEAIKKENSDVYTGDLDRKKRWYSPAADAYNAVRPKYSDKIIAYAVEQAHLTASSKLLEIGCGPGTATAAFALRGIAMTCLEPNQDFFRIAQRNCRAFPNVILRNLTFEEWPVKPKSYNAVMAASALHWVTAEIVYSKAAQSLVSEGYLVLLWNMSLQPSEEVNKTLAPVYQAHGLESICADAENSRMQDLSITRLGQNVIDSALFEDLNCYSETVRVSCSVNDYLLLLSTYSQYLALLPEIRDRLFHDINEPIVEQFGGNLDLIYKSVCHIARKV